jgi:hypothetical protein
MRQLIESENTMQKLHLENIALSDSARNKSPDNAKNASQKL